MVQKTIQLNYFFYKGDLMSFGKIKKYLKKRKRQLKKIIRIIFFLFRFIQDCDCWIWLYQKIESMELMVE